MGSVVTCILLILFESVITLGGEANGPIGVALQERRKHFISSCRESIRNVEVISVANRLGNINKPTGVQYSACSLAESLRRSGGGQMGVIGLTHASRTNKRSISYWERLFDQYLHQELPSDWYPMIPQLISKFYSLKNLAVLDYLDHLANDTLVLYVDAFDVLIQGHISALQGSYCEKQWEASVARFLKDHIAGISVASGKQRDVHLDASLVHAWHAEPLIFSAEENCFPYPNYWEKIGDSILNQGDAYDAYKQSQETYKMKDGRILNGDALCFEQERLASGERRFLNSGGVVGRVGRLRELLHLTIPELQRGEAMDQATWQLVWLQRPDLGVLDQDATIFLNMHVPERGAATLQPAGIVCDQLPVRIGGRTPLVLHFNGNGKRHYSRCRMRLLETGFERKHCEHVSNLDRFWNRSSLMRKAL